MGYAQYVGRVGALAVALGIGVAVANGGVANATTDPDADPGAAQGGEQNPGTPTVGNPGTTTPQDSDGPETPPVAIDGVEQNGNEGATAPRRIKPRVMILDILRGANILGARRPADHEPAPVKTPDANEEQDPVVDPGTGGSVAKFTAPTGSDPGKQVVSVPRTLQRTIAAVTASPQLKIAPPTRVLPGPSKAAAVLDTLTTQTQRQAATIAGPSTLADPLPHPPPPRSSPIRAVLNLLSSIGLRPENFPPGSPLAPIGQILEFAYAGLRRIDHQLFNQGPQESVLVQEPDAKTGVINGRVAYDVDDRLVLTTVPGEGPEHGTVVFNDDGTFTYTPNYNEKILPGTTDSFTVQVTESTDDHLHQAGDQHTITVEVSAFNVAPNLAVTATQTNPLPIPPSAIYPNGRLKDPVTVAVTPDGGRAYVVVNGTNEVRVLDTATNTFVGSPIAVGDEPYRIAINNAGTRAYVVGGVPGTSRDAVKVIDIDPTSANYNKVIATTEIGTTPFKTVEDVAVSPDDKRVYVTTFAGFDDGEVYVIDADPANAAADNTVIAVKTFVDDDNPAENEDNIGKMEFNPIASRNLAYITNVDDNEILVVNTDPASAAYMTVVKRISIAGPGTPQGIAVSEDGNRAYVVTNGGKVMVINTDPSSGASYNTVIATITVGLGDVLSYNGIAVSGNRVYVPVLPADTVSVIDTTTNTVITSVPVGNNPFDVAVSPDGTRLYVPFIGNNVGDGSPSDTDDGLSVISVLVPAIEA